MTLMAVDLAAKTMDYRQTERDFLLGGFREHDVMLRPMLGHPAAMYVYRRSLRDERGLVRAQHAHVTLWRRA